jgi:hypothetical protein
VTSAAAIAVLVGIGVEAVWRLRMRPRAAWNDGGVAVVTASDVVQLTWSQIRTVEADGGKVELHAADDSYRLAARTSPWWLTSAGERSIRQLEAALRDSRRRALSRPAAHRPEPPQLAYPRRPLALWIIWVGETALVSAIVLLMVP